MKRVNRTYCYLLSVMILSMSIISHISFVVYADDSIDWSEEYYYDIFADEMQKTTPFLNTERQELDYFLDSLAISSLNDGIGTAGNGFSKGFGSDSDIETLKMLGQIIVAYPEESKEIFGKVKYYKGEPYFADTKCGYFYKLTPQMKAELSTSELANTLNEIEPDGGKRGMLLSAMENNDINSLISFVGNTNEAISNVIRQWDKLKSEDLFADSRDTLGGVYLGRVCIGTKIQGVTTTNVYGDLWHTFSTGGQNITQPYAGFYGTAWYTAPGDNKSSVHPLYFRINADNSYWVNVYGTSYPSNTRNMMNSKFDYPLENSSLGWKIGTFGRSDKVPMKLPYTRHHRLLSENSIYNLDDVEDALDSIGDDILDAWQDNPFGYLKGQDDDEPIVPVIPYNSDIFNPSQYNDFATPELEPIEYDSSNGGTDGGGDNPGIDDPIIPNVVPLPTISNNGLPPITLESLNLPDLENLFPFCIPFDLYNGMQSMIVTEQEPIWIIPLNINIQGNQIVDDEITIDLTRWNLGTFWMVIRGILIIIFIIALAIFTIRIVN